MEIDSLVEPASGGIKGTTTPSGQSHEYLLMNVDTPIFIPGLIGQGCPDFTLISSLLHKYIRTGYVLLFTGSRHSHCIYCAP